MRIRSRTRSSSSQQKRPEKSRVIFGARLNRNQVPQRKQSRTLRRLRQAPMVQTVLGSAAVAVHREGFRNPCLDTPVVVVKETKFEKKKNTTVLLRHSST